MTRKASGSLPRPLRLTLWTVGVAGSMALGAFLLTLALREVQTAQVAAVFGRASVPLLLAGLGVFMLASLARGLRWWVLFVGVRVSLMRLLLVEHTALGVNNATPLPLLDEPVRVGLLALHGVPTGMVLATMATQRTFEFGAQALLASVGVLFLPPLRPLAPYIWGGVIVALAAVCALFLVGPRVMRIPGLGQVSPVRDFSRTVLLLRNRPVRVLVAFILTLAYALGIGMSGWLVAQAFALPIPLLGMVFLTLLTLFVADWIPGLPASVGTFEFIAVTLLDLWGVERASAFSFAILLHALLFLPPTLVAGVYLPVAGYRSVRAVLGLLRTRPSLTPPPSAPVDAILRKQ
ncbi:MAG: flippase-like domain-containing protein [Dehalococcoidia bacterium]|nr:flippase-like domain-containing protein [Dehalococcoidia bacterium]MDW8119802.1 lysylphosphatidylglycerol synthase transmembrane domain-containing protein [Chloroflexota bacterium]